MVASSSKMEAWLAGLANVRNARPLAPARPRYAPLMQPQRKLLTSAISLAVSLMRATLFSTSMPPPVLYNDNDACVKWSYNMTSKSACHIELCKKSVCEWVQDNTLNVKHVSGKLNPANIVTKEMHNGAHFRQLRDSFMSHLSEFLNDLILAIHHAS